MAIKRTSLPLVVIMGFVTACGPSQDDIYATSTMIAADIHATQTAQAPTPTETATPTPIPTPTQTPIPRPDYAAAILTLADLPPAYEEMPAENLEEFKRSFSEEPFPANTIFAYWDFKRPELLMGFTTVLITASEQEELDQELPFFTEGFIRGIAQGFGGSFFQEIEILDEFDELGDNSIGLTTVVDYENIPFRFDVVGFRRESIAAWIVLMYIDGETPTVSVHGLAQTLDHRIRDLLHVELLEAVPEYSFSLDQEAVDVCWNEDGSLSIAYDFVFTNDAIAAPIDFVDVAIPSEHYEMENASAEVDGIPIKHIAESTFLTGALELGLGDNAIPPGKTGKVTFRIHGIQRVLLASPDGEPSVHAIFAPTFFSPEFVHGTTDFRVVFHLPQDVPADEARWHTAPNGWPAEPTMDYDEDGRITAAWINPQANGHTQYVFIMSFPKVYVPENALVQQ